MYKNMRAKCQSASVITINLESPKIKVVPPNYCASPGDAIPVNIQPTQQKGTVRTIAKPGNPNWLSRSNSSYGNLIIIEVPVDACSPGTECEYYYSVKAPDKVPLDPMITVRR